MLLEIKEKLNNLTDEEKIEAIAFLGSVIFSTWIGIEKNHSVCGENACIIRTRIPVWTLVVYKKKGWDDSKILENFPTIQISDLAIAWFYYKINSKEIDQAILENEEI